MTTASCDERFQLLLEQLRDVHSREIHILRAEVALLQAKCAALDEPPGSDVPDVATVDGDSSHESSHCSEQQVGCQARTGNLAHDAPYGSTNSLWRHHSARLRDRLRDADGTGPGIKSLRSVRGSQFGLFGLGWKTMVSSPWFEAFWAALIMLNALVLGVEAQYLGLDVGFDLRYRRIDQDVSESWPGAGDTFYVLGWVFGVLFTLEVVIKLLCMQCAYLRECWNLLDLCVVTSWFVETFGAQFLPVNAQVVRLARLSRLLRLVRLARRLEGMDSLYLMTTAIRMSFGVLGWAIFLLTVIQMGFALLVNQLLHDMYFQDDSYSIEERRDVYEYFGTFSRALMSMFELTFANWPIVCRILSENVTEWFMLFCVAHKLTIGFAVLGVINGVFVQETFKVAACDDVLMVRQKKRAVTIHAGKMRRLFKDTDANGDGRLTLEEFQEVVREPVVGTWLGSMDLDSRDTVALFQLIDENMDGTISADELINGVARLKGAARSIDLNVMKIEQQKLFARLHNGDMSCAELITAPKGSAPSAGSKFEL